MPNNTFTLTGNISKIGHHKDKNDKDFAIIEMATNETYKKDNEDVQTPAIWHTVKVFAPKAVELSKTLTKGSLITVTGRIDYRTHSFDVDGQKHNVKEANLLCTSLDVLKTH